MSLTHRSAFLAALLTFSLCAFVPSAVAASSTATSTVTATDATGAVVDSASVKSADQVNDVIDDAAEEAILAPQPGALLGAGSNSLGELGQGDYGLEDNFWQSGRAEQWTTVATGSDTSCGIQAPGSLWCWGYGGYGQLGIGETGLKTTPTQVGTANDWTQIAVAQMHACGIRADSTLLCWGGGGYGQLGTGSWSNATTPQVVGDGFAAVSTGVASTCALKTDGTVWCWGYGGSGQLGTGKYDTKNTPQQVDGTGFASISGGGFHTCATKTDGSLWCWGDNNLGEAGVGNWQPQPRPVQTGRDGDWKSVSAAFDSTCAVKTSGTLWCWGYGGSGQLGLGDYATKNTPQQVGSAADWDTVSSTRYSTCARKSDTSFWCWGYNAVGQLGLGDSTARTTPARVTTPLTVDAIATGSTADQTLVISQDTTPVNACPEQETEKSFAALGDFADYAPAPGGLFESALSGWQLRNASVIDGNETVGITGGGKSLKLGGAKGTGSSEVITPEFCINETHPTFRYVARSAGKGTGVLSTALRFRPKNNPSLVIQIATRSTVSSTSWKASDPIPLATLIASAFLKRGGTVQLVFTTSSGTNDAGGVQIDSLLIDPYRRG